MIYLFGFFSLFLVIVPVLVPLVLDIGVSMKDFLVLTAYFGIVVAAFEVPSGYLSDLWGRKNSLVLAGIVGLLGDVLLYFSDSLFDLYIYHTVAGISFSLMSGADLSLLYDNDSKNVSDRGQKSNIIANYGFAKLSGESVAAIIGGILAVYSFKLVILGQIVASVFFLLVALCLKEVSYKKMDRRDHWANLKKTIRYLVVEKGIRLIFFNAFFWSLSTYSAIWLFQKQWQQDGVDLSAFGYIWASYTLTSAVSSKLVSFFRRKFGVVTCLLIISIFPLIGYLGMSSFSYYWAALFGYFFSVARSFKYVILNEAFNWKVLPEFRSTANSLMSLSFRVGFFLIGPILGIVVDRFGVQHGYQFLGLIFLFGFFIVMLPLILFYKNNKAIFS